MSKVRAFWSRLGTAIASVCELARYALCSGWALLLPKAGLAARLSAGGRSAFGGLAAESQLAVERNRSGGAKRRWHHFSAAFRLPRVVLSKFLEGWEDLLPLRQPKTVKRWHTAAFRRLWRRRA